METIPTGDWRNDLKKWIKTTNNNSKDWIPKNDVYDELMTELSIDLVKINYFSESGSYKRFQIRNCGENGVKQVNTKTGEMRYIGFYCGLRKQHIPCAIRYRRGQGIDLKNLCVEIANANELWGFYSWTFTLAEQVRQWIDDNPDDAGKFLCDVRRGITKAIKKTLNIKCNDSKNQIGFVINYHPSSSGNPFKQSSHFHVIIIPLILHTDSQTTTILSRHINHQTLKDNYKTYLDKILNKYGIHNLIKNQYVVHLYNVFLTNQKSVHHTFKYQNRSQANDIIKTVKRVSGDLDLFVCLLWDKTNQAYSPAVKGRAEIVNALQLSMSPVISFRMSYGYLRRLDCHSDMLNIEEIEEKDDQYWEDFTEINIRRVWTHIYNEDKQAVCLVCYIYIKNKGDPVGWEQLKNDRLSGEYCSLSSKARYRAQSRSPA